MISRFVEFRAVKVAGSMVCDLTATLERIQVLQNTADMTAFLGNSKGPST